MVHALRECGRLLRPGGQLIDMRPTGADRRIDVVVADQRFPAGLVDVAKGRPDDSAANAAIQQAVADGLFTFEQGVTFTFSNFWDSLPAARSYIEARWSDFSTVPDETWRAAETVLSAHPEAQARIEVHGPVQIVTYRRR